MRFITLTFILLLFHSIKCLPQKWSEIIANSVINRSPLKYSNKWDYVVGTVLRGFQELYEETGDLKYYDYLKNTVDYVLSDDGLISGYKKSDYNLDMIKEGNILLYLYKNTGNEKYKIAADTLRKQLKEQPRTSEGGFWHKLKYPYQMWLDGLYMAEPFYAEYSLIFNNLNDFDDVVNQFVIMEKHARNSSTGLLYHGWDEKKVQIWADPITGCSKSFWGRAIGWYMMGLVDVLDFLPDGYYKKDTLIFIFKRIVNAIVNYQDSSGCWFQVLDQGNRIGNYLESSATCMFVYSILKGIRKGYIDNNFLPYAIKGYNGIIKNFIVKNGYNYDVINTCCSAGLSDTRDGSFEYYISEPICVNDGKAIGPFILASLEYEKLNITGIDVKSKRDFYYYTDNKNYLVIVLNDDLVNNSNIKIISIKGDEVYSNKEKNFYLVNIYSFKSGIYILRLFNGKTYYSFKFLKF